MRLRKEIRKLGILVYRLEDPRDLESALLSLRKMPEVQYAEPCRRILLLVTDPNDYYYNRIDSSHALFPENQWRYQWPLHFIQAVGAWSVWPNIYYTSATKPRDAVKVAVIDTGIDVTHPDFKNAGGTSVDARSGGQVDLEFARNMINGGDNSSPNDPSDEFGHGTHVAGIVGAATNNGGTGIAALGYPAQVLPLKVTDPSGDGDDADVIDAMLWAADHGALVINLSLALNGGYSQALQDAVNYCWLRNVLVVAAAGNDGVDYVRRYPAACNRVLAVAATTFADANTIPPYETVTSYSTVGLYIGIAAPGGDASYWSGGEFGLTPELYTLVWSTTPTYDTALTQSGIVEYTYGYLNGTSMSAPHVAALAALYAGSKGFTQATTGAPAQIIRAIQRGADNIAGRSDGGWTTALGYGRINALATMLDQLGDGRPANTPGGIVGQVTYFGTPVLNASITAASMGSPRRYNASSKEDGTYRLANVPAGAYTVSCYYFGLLRSKTVTVENGCDALATDFEMGPSLVSVTITPHTATVPLGGTQAFEASVTGTSNTAVLWSVNGGPGTIGADGVYQAPASATTPATVEIQATSVADPTRYDIAEVTIPAVAVSLSPTNPTLTAGDTISFSATVSNAANTSVTWSISPSGVGSISSAGLYTSPSSVSSATTVTVTATSNADPTKSASTTVTIQPPTGPGVGTVTGFVRDSNRLPLSGAEVHLFLISEERFIASTAISGTDGAFTLSGVPTGRYHIGAYKGGYNGWIFSPSFRGYEVTPGATLGPIEIILDRADGAVGGIRGLLSVNDNGRVIWPGAGVTVEIYSGGKLLGTTTTDARNEFLFTNLPTKPNWWGWYTLRASWGPYSGASVNVGTWGGFVVSTRVVMRRH